MSQDAITSGEWLASPEELKRRGVKNMLPSLPLAPCVKHVQTRRIYPWHRVWAMRPEIFVCCDENGDESESAWRGRAPAGHDGHRKLEEETYRYQPDPTPKYQQQPTPPAKLVGQLVMGS
jgi:hypothetical protein